MMPRYLGHWLTGKSTRFSPRPEAVGRGPKGGASGEEVGVFAPPRRANDSDGLLLGTPPSAIDRRASGVKRRGAKTKARRLGHGTPRRVAMQSQAKSGGANPSEELRSVVKRRMATGRQAKSCEVKRRGAVMPHAAKAKLTE